MASAGSKKAEARKQKETKQKGREFPLQIEAKTPVPFASPLLLIHSNWTAPVCETVSSITLDSIPCFSNAFCIANPT